MRLQPCLGGEKNILLFGKRHRRFRGLCQLKSLMKTAGARTDGAVPVPAAGGDEVGRGGAEESVNRRTHEAHRVWIPTTIGIVAQEQSEKSSDTRAPNVAVACAAGPQPCGREPRAHQEVVWKAGDSLRGEIERVREEAAGIGAANLR